MRWRCAEILKFQRHLEISAHSAHVLHNFSAFLFKRCAQTALTSRPGQFDIRRIATRGIKKLIMPKWALELSESNCISYPPSFQQNRMSYSQIINLIVVIASPIGHQIIDILFHPKRNKTLIVRKVSKVCKRIHGNPTLE